MSYQIITINREFESTGNEIAQAVATKLCIPYYDKFLITAAAEHSGVRENRVEALDEKPESRFAYSQAEAAYYFTSAEAPLPTGAKVAEVQFRLIREIAAQGPCVIVGRCANHVLRDRKDVLDIFIQQANKIIFTDKSGKTRRLLTDQSYGEWSKKIDEIGALIGGWMNSVSGRKSGDSRGNAP